MRRERRLREAGLVAARKPWGGEEPVLVATADGLTVCGRDDLRVARASSVTLRHFSVVAHLAAGLEGTGEQLLSERELLALERAMGRRDFSIRLPGGGHHHPDLIALGELPTPIEVELSPKGNARLDDIVAGWAAAVDQGRFAGVRYLCSTEALPYVERAVGRMQAADLVKVELLPDDDLLATSLFT